MNIYDRIRSARALYDIKCNTCNDMLADVERQLTAAGACVEVMIDVPGTPYAWKIGWGRAVTRGKKWELIAIGKDKFGNAECVALIDTPREVRVAAAEKIYELLDRVAEAMEAL